MSNIYIQEPPSSGKIVMKTSVGDIDVELWTREAPKACRNFIQLCMDGYYNNTIFHRVVKGFIVQGGDPTGTGEGGESIYGQPFKDEFHSRLRFCRRGLLAMANAGKDDNASQFFFTMAATPELQNKHTIFAKVTGETIYNMLKLEDGIVDQDDRPLYPQKIIKTDILSNPFDDIKPRVTQEQKKSEEDREKKRDKRAGVKNFKLLSFGAEAEEDEEESVVLSKQYHTKGKSAHDNLSDPKLSSDTGDIPSTSSKKSRKHSSDESESEEETEERETSKPMESTKTAEKQEESESEEEYYLGKDRDDERKRQIEAAQKEIRDFKRGVQKERKEKEAEAKEKAEEDAKKEKLSEFKKEYIETQREYKKAKEKIPPKGKQRENFTLQLLNKFKSKLSQAMVDEPEAKKSTVDDNDDSSDTSWMTEPMNYEDTAPVLAKDASTKDDDWFEIYDPRNPINKRRRGETTGKDKSSNKKSRN